MTQNLSGLIERLVSIKAEHGDLPVFIDDADTRGDWGDSEGWNLEISLIRVVDEGDYPDNGRRVLIGGSYFDE